MNKIKIDMENVGKVELQPKFDGNNDYGSPTNIIIQVVKKIEFCITHKNYAKIKNKKFS